MSAESHRDAHHGWSTTLFGTPERPTDPEGRRIVGKQTQVNKEASKPSRNDQTGPTWFNPEVFTNAKRRWLLRNKKGTLGENDKSVCAAAQSPLDDGESDDSFYAQTESDEKEDTETEQLPPGIEPTTKQSPFEKFYICGLPRDADVTASASSELAARSANQNGSDFVAFGPKRGLARKPHRGASGVAHPPEVLYEYPPRSMNQDGIESSTTGGSGGIEPRTATNGEGSTTTTASTLNTPTRKHQTRKKPPIALPNVADFCFPDGVLTKLLERTNSLSALHDINCSTKRTPGVPGGGVDDNDRSFIFSVGGGDEDGDDEADASENTFGEFSETPKTKPKNKAPRVVWGICVYAEELVRREPFICAVARKFQEARAKLEWETLEKHVLGTTVDGTDAALGLPPTKQFSTTDPDAPPKLTRKPTRERYLVTADRCYVFLSTSPVFEWHFEVLRAIVSMERLQRLREVASEMVGEGEGDGWGGDVNSGELETPPKTPNGDVAIVDDGTSLEPGNNDSPVDSDDPMQDSDAYHVLTQYACFDTNSRSHKLGGAFGAGTETVQRAPVFKTNVCSPMTFPGEFHETSRGNDVYESFLPRLDPGLAGHGNANNANAPTKAALANLDTAVVSVLCRVLSLETLLTAVTGCLLERRVLVFHPNLGVLSAIVVALSQSMLRPLKWSSLVLPVLPDTMFDFLDAPVPYVVGVRRKTHETRTATSLPGVVRLNAYKDDCKVCVKKKEGSLPSLPGKPELVKSLRRSYDACRDASRKAETLHVPFPWGLSIQGDGGDCDCADDGLIGEGDGLIGEDNKGIGEHEASLGEASDGDTTEPSNGDTPHRTTRGTPRDTTHSTTHTTNTFSDSKNTRLFGDLSHSKTNARSAARDARRAASIFLDTWREYLTALVGDNALRPHSITDVTGYEKITVLMKESFVDVFGAGDRNFAKALTETQSFEQHADRVLGG